MRVIKTYTLVLIIFSFSWGQIIDTSPYFISLQGLQEVLSEKEKEQLMGAIEDAATDLQSHSDEITDDMKRIEN